jgi:quinol monooxygenase YgiN
MNHPSATRAGSGFVVTVEFVVKPEFLAAFMPAMIENASTSRRVEPGCRQFDVCVLPADRARIFLYEIYDDRAAFDAHLAAPHFKAFDAKVAEWVASKSVRLYERVDPR